jgi:hypothetical protein
MFPAITYNIIQPLSRVLSEINFSNNTKCYLEDILNLAQCIHLIYSIVWHYNWNEYIPISLEWLNFDNLCLLPDNLPICS